MAVECGHGSEVERWSRTPRPVTRFPEPVRFLDAEHHERAGFAPVAARGHRSHAQAATAIRVRDPVASRATVVDDEAVRGAWGTSGMVTAVAVALLGCQPRPTSASAVPQGATALVLVPSATEDESVTEQAPPPSPTGLPPVPRLVQRPIKVGKAYTVWGASYSLRHVALHDTIDGQTIEVRGVIGKTNLMDAPSCAVHAPGIADPPGCWSPVPEFWLCDDRNDPLEDCIRVMGWASNYAQLYKAIRSCALDPPAPVVDSYWGKQIACPIPAAGATVVVTGTYSTTFTGASSGAAADPVMGILTSNSIETRAHPPAPARLP